MAVAAEDGLALFGMGVKCHCSSKDAEVQEETLEIPGSTPQMGKLSPKRARDLIEDTPDSPGPRLLF